MKRYGIVVAMWLCGAGVCLAQQGPGGELQGYYQRIQTFKMRSGGDVFSNVDNATNGGGFGFLYNVTDRFGIYQQMGFFGGAKDELSGITMRMITEFQGVQLTKRTNAVDFYVKGGLGFTRYTIQEGGDSKMAFQYGGGAEIKIDNSMYIILDITRVSMGVPQFYYTDDRSKWCNTFQFGTGIAIRF
jgi:hypothetical protein